jgi:hypothetical protein
MRFYAAIEVKDVDSANAIAKASFDPVGGEFTFGRSPLNIAGSPIDSAATHYWCSANADDALRPAIQQALAQFTGSKYSEGDGLSPEAVLAGWGLQQVGVVKG